MRLIVAVVLAATAGAAFIAWRAAAHVADRDVSSPLLSNVPAALESAAPAHRPANAPATEVAVTPTPAQRSPAADAKPVSTSGPLPRGEIKWAPSPEMQRARAVARFEAAREAFTRDPQDDGRFAEAVAKGIDAEAWPELVVVLEQAVEAAPENLDRRFELAAAQMRLSLWASAIEQLRVVVAGRPEDRRAVYNLAVSLTAAARLQEALEAWDRVVGLGADADSLARRAEVQMDLGTWKDAAVNLVAAQALTPDSAEVTLNLAMALERCSKPVDAEALLAKFVERHPENVPAMARLAELVWRNHEMKLTPADGVENRGACAALLCGRILAVDPNHADARALRDRITNGTR